MPYLRVFRAVNRQILTAAAAIVIVAAGASAAQALDLNGFRAQHKLPPLSVSGMLAAAAYSHAADMASRNHLDHNGFRERMSGVSSTAAENVLWGCDSEDCAIRMWAKSAGHRANMLLRGVSSYGLASALAANGRRYWVMELGN
jgi:uncharacterized protein YkwD